MAKYQQVLDMSFFSKMNRLDIPVLGNQGTGDFETSCPVHRKPLLSIILETQQV